MSSELAPTSGRPRPQSGGFRTFFSWLKRDEKINERSESVESISSGGSDRTVTSFAYLTPAHYSSKSTVEPILLPPPGPPSDTYRKRIQDRDLRRHLERNLTLHRKYQLPIDTTAFDALSLPHERRDCGKNDRGRRATSELYERRAPYVPGKRRAPVPPNRTGSLTSPVNAPTNRKIRKRPAPQPPVNPDNKANKENNRNNENRSDKHSDFKMTAPAKQTTTNFSSSIVNKVSDAEKTNIVKNQPERNFFKQIFESKKRISVCDPVAVRLLPNISELDRQAAEILQMKMRNSKRSDNSPEVMSRFSYTGNVSKQDVNEKEELKKMLKEMKDSLPKRAKPNAEKVHDKNMSSKSSTSNSCTNSDPTTLRIGSNDHQNWQWSPLMQLKCNKSSNKNSSHNLLQNKSSDDLKTKYMERSTKQKDILQNKVHVKVSKETHQQHKNTENTDNVPIVTGMLSEQKSSILPFRNNIRENASLTSISQSDSVKPLSETLQVSPLCNANKSLTTNKDQNIQPTSNISTDADKVLKEHDEIRRNLIFELERCIVVGDEHGASNAAMRLAQLRLPQKMLSSSLLVAKEESKKNQIEKIFESPQKVSNKSECDIKKVIPNKIEQNYNKGNQSVSTLANNKETDLTKHSIVNHPKKSIPDVVPSCSEKKTTHDIVRDIIISKQTQVKPSTSSETKAKIVESCVNNKKIVEQVQTATSSEKSTDNEASHENNNPVEVWIEDREAVRGPISLYIRRDANLADLRKQTELTLGIPKQLQKWIVGRTLCSDDNISVESLAGPDFRTPFYLYLVELDTIKDATKASPVQHTAKEEVITATNENVYNELILLEHCALVPNTEKFECGVCIVEYSAGEGVVLKECVHTFCRECLSALVKHCEEPVVACPAAGCTGYLQEREIRELVSPEEYERWLARGLAAAESVARHSFHCRTRDCTGWALCEPGVRLFPCPVCKHNNCVPCEAIHEGMTCDQHRINNVKKAAAIDLKIDDEDTKTLLDRLIERGEALACPECNTIIIKKWGCDWVRCSACKTEICWVTRGRRWGPGGRGDTSAGCRCGVDGKRCHPACSYCH